MLATVDFDRGAFSCAVSTDPEHPRLFVVGQEFTPQPAGPTGVLAAYPAPVPAANRPIG